MYNFQVTVHGLDTGIHAGMTLFWLRLKNLANQEHLSNQEKNRLGGFRPLEPPKAKSQKRKGKKGKEQREISPWRDGNPC